MDTPLLAQRCNLVFVPLLEKIDCIHSRTQNGQKQNYMFNIVQQYISGDLCYLGFLFLFINILFNKERRNLYNMRKYLVCFIVKRKTDQDYVVLN